MIALIKKIFFLLGSTEKKKSLIFVILTILNIVFELFALSLIIPITQIILQQEVSILFFDKFNFFPLDKDDYFFNVSLSLSILLFVYISKNLFYLFFGFWQNSFSGNIDKIITKKLFFCYLYQPYQFHLNNNSALLTYNVLNEAPNIGAIVKSFLMIIVESVLLFSIIILLLFKEPKGSIIVITCTFLIMVSLNLIIKKYSSSFGFKRHIFLSESNKNILQAFSNIKNIIIGIKQNTFLNKFSFNFSEATKFRVYYDTLTIFPKLISEIILILAFILLVLTLVINESSTSNLLATVSLFLVASYRLIPSILRIITSFQVINGHRLAAEKILSKINEYQKEVSEKISDSTIAFKDEINIKNLCFYYDEINSKNILKNLNIKIKKNQIVGIVGESGIGKTTLVDLILGLLKPTAGEITVDGTQIDETNISSWYSLVGYVPQSITFLDSSIEKNIAFGLKENEIDSDKLQLSISRSNIKNFILKLPEGLKTNIGENGTKISGGQRQRIAIARALYHNPEILIFDEPTSALDAENEESIFKNLKELSNFVTIIVISHNRALLKNYCDKIYEISNNKDN